MPQHSGHRKSRRRQLQASHQKNWLTDVTPSWRRLRAACWPASHLYVADDLCRADRDEVQHLANTADVPTQSCSRDRLTELCGSEHHQGYIAQMAKYPYLSVAALLQTENVSHRAEGVAQHPLLVVCDRIQDTFNFGAILRCCDAMNVAGVIIGQSQQAGVTPQVARSSSGAVNHIPIAATDDLLVATSALKADGFRLRRLRRNQSPPRGAAS